MQTSSVVDGGKASGGVEGVTLTGEPDSCPSPTPDYEADSQAWASGQESEARYRTLFETMGQGYALVELVRDASGKAVDQRYLEFNPAIERLLGITVAEASGKLASEVFPAIEPWWTETFERVVREGRPERIEHFFAPLGRWFEVYAYPAGQDRFITLYEDTTERKRAEAVLRENERRQAFLLSLTDAIRSEPSERAVVERALLMLAEELAVDRCYATRLCPAEDLTEVIHEVRSPCLVPMPLTFRNSDFPEAFQQTFDRTLVFNDTANDPTLADTDKSALASMSFGAFLSRPLRRDGSPIFSVGVVSSCPRCWTDGEIVLVEEVTERTWAAVERARAEAALRDSEARFRALATVGSSSVYRMSPDWREMRQLDGRAFLADTDEATADWVDTYIPSDERPRVREAIGRAIATKGVFELEHRVLRADGTVGWTFSRAIPLLDDAGAISEWFGAATDVTARVKADQSFTRLFQASPAPFLVLKPDAPRFTIAAVNDAYLSATMRSREEVVGRGVFEAYPDNPAEGGIGGVNPLRASFERVLASRQPDTLPGLRYDLARPNGTFEERWWSPVNSAVLDDDGNVEALIHNANDVTEERRAGKALHDSEARLAAAFESVPVGLAVIDMSGSIMVANSEYRRFLPTGVMPSRDPERGARWRGWDARGGMLDPLDFPGARALRGEHVVPGQEMLYTDDDGRELWTSVASVPTRDDSGRVTGLISVISDVDTLKRSTEALRASEARFRQFSDASTNILWIRNAVTLRMEFASPAYDKIYGIPAPDRGGDPGLRSWARLIEPESRKTVLASFRRVRAGERIEMEFRVRRASDGALRWIHNTDFPLRDAAGNVRWVAGLGADITDAKETADRQSVLVAELQHRTRNLIAVVRSLSDRTLSNAASLDDFGKRFRLRLAALSRVQGLLSHLAAGERVAFDELLRSELTAHGALDGAAAKVALDGPTGVPLRSGTVQTLALALHELSTNAVKYGALAAPEGHLAVRWHVEPGSGDDPPRLHVEWQESGVVMPQFSKPSRGGGYGRELIERALPYQLKAKTSYELGADGVRCTIAVPISRTASEEVADDE